MTLLSSPSSLLLCSVNGAALHFSWSVSSYISSSLHMWDVAVLLFYSEDYWLESETRVFISVFWSDHLLKLIIFEILGVSVFCRLYRWSQLILWLDFNRQSSITNLIAASNLKGHECPLLVSVCTQEQLTKLHQVILLTCITPFCL